MEVQKVSVTLPISAEWADDIMSMQCMIWLGMSLDLDPLTDEESQTGWRTRTHGDHDHTYAVGSRAEEQRKAAEAEREVAMAACPYVECTCGHHED